MRRWSILQWPLLVFSLALPRQTAPFASIDHPTIRAYPPPIRTDNTIFIRTTTKTSQLSASSSSSDNIDDGDTNNNDDAGAKDEPSKESNDDVDWELEETLLAIHLQPLPGKSLDECLARVSAYTQSFPFAAVLPVQPLQYLPADDGVGVDLKFMRKKTDMKSGIDGGIRFFVREKASEEGTEEVLLEEEEDEEENDKEIEEGDTLSEFTTGIEIVAKRNSRGQTIPKMFAEKLVVQAFVRALTNGADESASSTEVILKTRFESPTKDSVAVISVFHKWMDIGR